MIFETKFLARFIIGDIQQYLSQTIVYSQEPKYLIFYNLRTRWGQQMSW